MERSAAEGSDVAVADLPSTSGAHWANRDNDSLYRRPGDQPAPLRRSSAVNSFFGDEAEDSEPDTSARWDAFAPSERTDTADAARDLFGAAPPAASSSRASFGVTAGPISGARPEPVFPAAPSVPASAPPPAAPHAAEPPRSRLVVAATVALSLLVLLGGAVAGVAFFAEADGRLASVLRRGSGDGKVATAPLGGRTAATFEMLAATTKMTLRTQDLGDDLYKITSAGDSGTSPSPLLRENKVQLLLSGDGAGGTVEVLLSTKVSWALRFVGAADEQVVDLTGGKVSSIDIAGGSRRVDLTLPAPTGTVPVRVTGAIAELSLTAPAGNPVRVRVNSGAKTVAAGTRTLRNVKPGSTLTPKDWKAPNRYDVLAASRITLLTVGRPTN